MVGTGALVDRSRGLDQAACQTSPMDDAEKRQLLAEHWERHANADDFEQAHAIYHDDAILEWPQSGERFVGKETLRAMREGAPPLTFTTWRITGSGDHWTAENLMSVAGQPPQLTINVLEFRGERVAREIVYITERFDAAPERAPFATRFDIPTDAGST
jgi:hypothetical protein